MGPFFCRRTLLAADEDVSLHWKALSALLVLGLAAFVGSMMMAAYLPVIGTILVSLTLGGVYLLGGAAFAQWSPSMRRCD